MLRTIAILACFLLSVGCFPQQYAFVKYTSNDGLVNNRTRFIFQDSKGLLYISTFGGLSVFDGSRFTNYTTDNGLSTSLVNDIVEIGYDSLWLIPNGGKIQCMVHGVIKDLTTTDSFYPVINRLFKFSDGYYYAIADEGLYRFTNNQFQKIKLSDGNNEAVNLVNAIELNGRLVITTDPNFSSFPGAGVLVVYDPKKQEVLFGKGLPTIFSMSIAPSNEILVATSSGIFKLDNKELENGKISFSKDIMTYNIPENAGAMKIFFDKQKNLWLLGNGVLKIEKDGGIKKFDTGNGLSESEQISVFDDKENIIWFSSANSGITKLVNQGVEINFPLEKNFSVSALDINKDTDSVWMLDAKNNKLLLQYNNQTKIFSSNDKSQFIDVFASAKNIYLTNETGIYKVNFAGNTFTSIPVFKSDPGMTGFSDIWFDKNENLVAISDKIVAFFKDKKTVSIPLGYLSDQACLNGDLLWVVTRNSKLFLYRIHPDDPENYLEALGIYEKQLSALSPRSMVADKQNRVWIGSRNHGLFCFQYKDGEIKLLNQLTTKNGLSENFISYLHCDSSNNIWSCSPSGLDKISELDGRFYVENITKNNIIFQQVLNIATTKSGIHWALSTGGIIRINKEIKAASSYTPGLLFTQIFASNKRITDTQKEVSFKYSENAVSFQVAVPSYLDETLVRYSYLLKGSGNNSWTEPSRQSEINFAGLAPGHYILKAKAEFLNGVYPEQESSFAFTILPPWWQAWWFRIVAGILIFGLLISGIRFYYNRKLEKQKTILEKQQAVEQERSRIAADMHDDLGAGLTNIKYITEHILERADSGETVKPDLEKLKNFSSELVESMGEIIWAVSEKNNLLSSTLYYLRSYAINYCEENDLDCYFEIPENFKDRIVSGNVRRNIFLLLKESLHNIVKHASANKITITAAVTGKLKLVIKDDGKGFSNNGDSKGNGLINMKKRVRELNGSIFFENDNGAVVVIHLPFSTNQSTIA